MTEQVHFNRYEWSNCGKVINQCDVSGPDAEQITEALLPFIRPQSRQFYSHMLREDLHKYGKSLVDVHAGCGTHYTVKLDQ